MKKLICAIVAIMLTFTVALGLCACGETETPSGGNETPGTEQPSTPGGDTEKPGGDTEKPGGEAEKPADPAKANFTGLTMSDVTVTYDGTEHVVTINGEVQGGASVVYENNKATNAGTYNVKATVTKDNYNTLVLNAKLVINKANIADGLLTLSDETVEYDGLSHTLAIVGNVPDGCTVTYLYNGENVVYITAKTSTALPTAASIS